MHTLCIFHAGLRVAPALFLRRNMERGFIDPFVRVEGPDRHVVQLPDRHFARLVGQPFRLREHVPVGRDDIPADLPDLGPVLLRNVFFDIDSGKLIREVVFALLEGDLFVGFILIEPVVHPVDPLLFAIGIFIRHPDHVREELGQGPVLDERQVVLRIGVVQALEPFRLIQVDLV